MIYQHSYTYPANGSFSTRVKTSLSLDKGLVYRIEIDFPPGSCGLLKLRIMKNTRQLWPFPPGEWFRGERTLISFDETHFIRSSPYEVVIEGYNEDTYYDHLGIIRIGFIQEDDYILRYVPQNIEKYIGQLEMEKESREEKEKELILKTTLKIKERMISV